MFEPTNEQGVVSLFMLGAKDAGWDIVEIGTSFPDAILRKDGVQWRVEFEYKSGNFLQHRHDPRECDIIVCWINDYPDSPIPVLSIKSSDWKSESPQKVDPRDVEIVYWRNQCKKFEAEIERLRSRIDTIITPEEKAILEVSREESVSRRRSLLRYCLDAANFSYQKAADDLCVTSKATVYNDLKWLERYGYISVNRGARITTVTPNKDYQQFLAGG